jgi:hypothetical protein
MGQRQAERVIVECRQSSGNEDAGSEDPRRAPEDAVPARDVVAARTG